MAAPNFTSAFSQLLPLGWKLPKLEWPKAAIARAIDPSLLAADVATLPPLIEGGGLQAFLAPASGIPNVLAEIGRLREIAFRAAGEGTGRSTDLDSFDRHYLHLFLWNPDTREVAGAYRLRDTSGGPRTLYTATLFHYGPELLAELGPALELGRSFVRAEYQRSFAPLLLLWKAIGRHISRNPQYRTLFGPVSISNRYQRTSRDLMLTYLETHAWLEASRPVRPRNPPARGRVARVCRDIDELNAAIASLEPGREGIPVLLRHYLRLGGRLLAFNQDREFSHAIDGFIVVDLTQTEPRLLERYLGKAEAGAFLEYQKGIHGIPPAPLASFPRR